LTFDKEAGNQGKTEVDSINGNEKRLPRSPRRKSSRRRHRRKKIAKTLRRLLPIAVWFLPVALLASIVITLAWPFVLTPGKPDGWLGSWVRKKVFPQVADELPTTGEGWRRVLQAPEAGIREYRGAFDQDYDNGGALLEEVGNLDALATTLLSLGGTNQADVTRVLRAYGVRLDSHRVLGLAGVLDVRSNPEASRWISQALLVSGDVLAFDQASASSPEAFATDAQLRPWRLAADVLLREGEASRRARSSLAGMTNASNPSQSAWQALRLIAFLTGDASGHRELLDSHQVRGDQRLRYWIDHVELLAARDAWTEVDDVMDGLPLDLTRPDEVAEAVKRLARMGQPSRGSRLADRQLRLDPSSVRVAVMGAFCSLAAGQWDECSRLAIAMRMRTSTAGQVVSISRYLLGCAASGSGSESRASDAFEEMAFGSDPQSALQFEMLVEGVRLAADRLNKASARQAWLVARELEGSLGSTASYWRMRSELAGYALQVPDMLLAARAALRQDPRSPASLACMVRALLFMPDGKPEVLELSAALMQGSPALAESRLLRAMALATSNKAAEAKAILQPMRPSVIPPSLRGLLGIAWLDVHVASQNWDAARKTLDGIRSLRWEPLMQAKVDRLAVKIPEP
jgi:hypothetical protein